ncbi:MAG TPA: alanyl-tRNA editing protein [Anaerolineae bacterium]|nr:alanyl-tRNA editing protein [Anaerolineae bacterium]
MSKRLYYEASYQRALTAKVVESLMVAGRPAVVLDESCFYPSSGGQPYDTGVLNGVAVEDVWVRESDEAVVHQLAAPLAVGTAVTGEINWERRFDHMQQHSGQHILSQAFLRVAEAATIGFHLGEVGVTIDLDCEQLSDSQVGDVEQMANEIVWENRPIRAYFVPLAEAQSLDLRKIPDVKGDTLRLVDIDDFDLTACGGTHVTHTGGVGLIKILKAVRYKQGYRIEFRCGGRAVADYGMKHQLLTVLSNTLTTGYDDLPNVLTKLQEENKELQKSQKQLGQQLSGLEGRQLWTDGERVGGMRVVMGAFTDKDAGEVRQLASVITGLEGGVALLASVMAERTHFVFGRHEEAVGDMNQILQMTLGEIGGRGGGRPNLAQGGGVVTDEARVTELLSQAYGNWRENCQL